MHDGPKKWAMPVTFPRRYYPVRVQRVFLSPTCGRAPLVHWKDLSTILTAATRRTYIFFLAQHRNRVGNPRTQGTPLCMRGVLSGAQYTLRCPRNPPETAILLECCGHWTNTFVGSVNCKRVLPQQDEAGRIDSGFCLQAARSRAISESFLLTSNHLDSYSPNHLVFGKAVRVRHYPVTVSTEN